MSSLYNLIKDEKVKQENKKFVAGNYEGTINRIVMNNTRDGAPLFVMEVRIDKSDNPELEVGDMAVVFQGFRFRSLAAETINNIIKAATKLKNVEFTQQMLDEEVAGPKQLLSGKKLKIVASDSVSKKGRPFVRLDFSPVK